jgi:hypothetical protein
VKADGELGVILAHRHGLSDGGAGGHEAGAGQHAPRVALQNAAIDARACAEVVCVEDEVFSHGVQVLKRF